MSNRDYIDIVSMHEWNKHLFDQMVLPDGIDRQTTIDTIKMNCRELEVTLPSPDFLQFSIGLWSRRFYYYFDEMFKTMNYEYNPIDNYDRNEVFHSNTNNTGSTLGTENETGTFNNKSKTEVDNTITENVSAFNETVLQPRSQSVTDGETNGTASGGTEKNKTNKVDSTGKEVKDYTLRARGNIGTKSTQSMIMEQRDVVNISIYEIIATSFKSEFCILIY